MTAPRPRSRHLAELVAELAERDPDALAVISAEETLSAAELERRVDAFAAGLRTLGVRRGSTVGLLCTNRWEWLCTAFGAMRLGARVAAFNTFVKAWDLDYMLAHSGADVLVTLDRFRASDFLATLGELLPELEDATWAAERYPRLRAVVAIGSGLRPAGVHALDDVLAAGAAAPAAEPEHTSAADDAFVLYTSGSTSRPKAVPLQQYAVIENGFAIGERMGLRSEDRVWVSVPLFWAYGAANAVPATLTHGAALVLQPAFDAGEALELIEAHEATAGYTLPNMTNALLMHPDFDVRRTASMRTGLTLGGAADVRRAARELAIPEICNIYGGTETYGNCCVTPVAWPLERKLESQGPPLPGVELRIVGEDGAVLPAGEVGEVRVRGYVMRGYLGTDAGSAVFDDDGWFRSGDLASLDADGCLHFSARGTEMIKTGGINVAPSEVEEFLVRHEDVGQAAVVGVEDAKAGQAVVAFVVPAVGHHADPAALRAWCAAGIAGYKVPARIHVVEQLPKTETGKLARRALADLDGPQSAAPSSDDEGRTHGDHDGHVLRVDRR
ncbi:MAG: AMP-binding protein [Conexibacter sp.]|nr:AMP-binding protein [Conexibacter sp.]